MNTHFKVNMFLSGVRKNICAASFRDAQELHSLSALKGNIYIILCISVRESLFQRRSKFLPDWKGWGWVGEEAE